MESGVIKGRYYIFDIPPVSNDRQYPAEFTNLIALGKRNAEVLNKYDMCYTQKCRYGHGVEVISDELVPRMVLKQKEYVPDDRVISFAIGKSLHIKERGEYGVDSRHLTTLILFKDVSANLSEYISDANYLKRKSIENGICPACKGSLKKSKVLGIKKCEKCGKSFF